MTAYVWLSDSLRLPASHLGHSIVRYMWRQSGGPIPGEEMSETSGQVSNRIGVARIERLTRDVIADYGLPMDVVVVHHEPPHWRVIVRESDRRMLTIEIPDSSTITQLRERLKDRLLAET